MKQIRENTKQLHPDYQKINNVIKKLRPIGKLKNSNVNTLSSQPSMNSNS